MDNPYRHLPNRAFWKSGVAQRHLFDTQDLWDPKFPLLHSEALVTFGSCFAAHMGAELRARGFNWLSTEPPPPGMSAANATTFNYDIFSARTGNIYTASLLRQWLEWAFEITPPPQEIWRVGARFFDPFRPRIEPNGFESAAHASAARQHTISCLRRSVLEARHFLFTLGQTEAWINTAAGYEYPNCPGTVRGEFVASVHGFRKMSFNEVHESLAGAIAILRQANPRLNVILTVSPVPLVATCSGQHVLVATTEAKAILRAVAAQAACAPFIDYFPAYEIISNPVFRGIFFEPNQRTIHPGGVRFVMSRFFAALAGKSAAVDDGAPSQPWPQQIRDAACDEELLEAFGR